MRPLLDLERDLRALSTLQHDSFAEEVGYLDDPQGPMFYVLVLPAGGDPRGGIVVCPSLFEMATLQPVELRLLRRAARAGFAGLYLQPAGVGESGGDPAATRISTRVQAALEGAAMLERRASGAPVCYFGARLGASVACMAASTGAASGLIAWDPSFDPEEYVKQIRRLVRISAVAGGSAKFTDPFQRLSEQGRISILGNETSAEQVDDVRALDRAEISVAGPALAVLLGNRTVPGVTSRLGAVDDLEVVRLEGRDMAGLGMSVREAPEAVMPTLEWLERKFH